MKLILVIQMGYTVNVFCLNNNNQGLVCVLLRENLAHIITC